MVSGLVINTLMSEVVMLGSLPILLFAIFRFRYRVSFVSAITGFIAYLFFALELKGVIHSLFSMTSVGAMITSNPLTDLVYLALITILFDEGGRALMFKYVLKYNDGKAEPISFGVFFGGLDAIIASGLSAFAHVTSATVLNELGRTGFIESFEGSEATIEELEELADSIINISFADCVADIFERLLFLTMHIALSVIVYYAVKKKNYKYFAFDAVLRFAMLIPTVFVSFGMFSGKYTNVGIEAVILMIIVFVAVKLYKDYDYEDDPFADIEKVKRMFALKK